MVDFIKLQDLNSYLTESQPQISANVAFHNDSIFSLSCLLNSLPPTILFPPSHSLVCTLPDDFPQPEATSESSLFKGKKTRKHNQEGLYCIWRPPEREQARRLNQNIILLNANPKIKSILTPFNKNNILDLLYDSKDKPTLETLSGFFFGNFSVFPHAPTYNCSTFHTYLYLPSICMTVLL